MSTALSGVLFAVLGLFAVYLGKRRFKHPWETKSFHDGNSFTKLGESIRSWETRWEWIVRTATTIAVCSLALRFDETELWFRNSMGEVSAFLWIVVFFASADQLAQRFAYHVGTVQALRAQPPAWPISELQSRFADKYPTLEEGVLHSLREREVKELLEAYESLVGTRFRSLHYLDRAEMAIRHFERAQIGPLWRSNITVLDATPGMVGTDTWRTYSPGWQTKPNPPYASGNVAKGESLIDRIATQ